MNTRLHPPPARTASWHNHERTQQQDVPTGEQGANSAYSLTATLSFFIGADKNADGLSTDTYSTSTPSRA